MSERTRPCAVEDCDRLTGVPGSARGWCHLHYQRWKRHGDLNHKRPAPMGVGIAECSVEECEKVVKARGWCVKHWTRWQRFGDPDGRLRGEVRDGRRVCPRCGEDKPLSEWGTGYCRRCWADIAAERRLVNPPPRVPGEPRSCRCCSQTFMANKCRSTYCSRECFQQYRHKANWKHLTARRARIRAAFVESFDRREIFERDGWVCQICLVPVDRNASFPHPASPSPLVGSTRALTHRRPAWAATCARVRALSHRR